MHFKKIDTFDIKLTNLYFIFSIKTKFLIYSIIVSLEFYIIRDFIKNNSF